MADIQRLGEYRVDREIARSSIASIYEGFQESLDRKVLIKRLHPQLVGDAEIRSRFEREARAIARLKHKNVVHIYDYRADNDLVLLVSEWIGGGSVEELVRKDGPLTEREAVALAIDVLEGLMAAHEMGIIHRDIKPGNLLISTSGAIKITDFGLAQFEGAPSLTQQGNIMGTPAYMAPELISGIPADARSDLYNLGITLYELLAGINPFRSDNMSQTLNRVMSLKPEPLEGIREDFNQFILSMMDKKPDKRPQTARDALERIRAIGSELGVERGWGAIERTARDAESSRTTIRPATRAIPRRRYVWTALFLMVAATAAVWVFQTPFDDPSGVDTTGAAPEESVLAAIVGEDSIYLPASRITEEKREVDLSGSLNPAQKDPAPPPSVQEEKPRESVRSDVDTSKPERVEELATQPIQSETESMTDESSSGAGTDEEMVAPVVVKKEQVAEDGFLYLTVHPWANVYFEDRLLFQTPYNRAIELPSGTIELTLINPEFPPVTHKIDIPSGDTTSHRINLFEEVGTIEFLDATPWAEVYLDGDYLGRTPIGRPVFVRPGVHRLSFHHPSLPDKEIEFEAVAGDEAKRFHVNLTESP